MDIIKKTAIYATLISACLYGCTSIDNSKTIGGQFNTLQTEYSELKTKRENWTKQVEEGLTNLEKTEPRFNSLEETLLGGKKALGNVEQTEGDQNGEQ